MRADRWGSPGAYSEIESIERSKVEIGNAFNRIVAQQDALKNAQGLLEQLTLEEAACQALCEKLCKKANTAQNALSKIAEEGPPEIFEEMQGLLSRMEGKYITLGSLAKSLELAEECTSKVKAVEPVVVECRALLEAAKPVVELTQKLRVAGKHVEDILKTSDAFVETHLLPSRSTPTRYDLTLTRTKLDGGGSKSVKLGSIQIGTSRFSISAGLGLSFIEDETFGRQQGPGDDGTPQTVFAVTETSSEHLAGVIQLNARLGRLGKAGVIWSVGAGLSSGDSTTEVSLYTGPGLALLDDRFFINLAYHQRSIEELVGFEVGDPIPMELQDPLPTRKEDKGGFLLTLTYRFSGGD